MEAIYRNVLNWKLGRITYRFRRNSIILMILMALAFLSALLVLQYCAPGTAAGWTNPTLFCYTTKLGFSAMPNSGILLLGSASGQAHTRSMKQTLWREKVKQVAVGGEQVTLEVLHADTTDPRTGREFTAEEMQVAFSLIENRDNWKNPIDARIPESMRDVVAAAIRFFAGCEASFTLHRPGVLRVQAGGYYEAVGA